MKVFFATDHAGFELKEIVKEFVHTEMGYEIEDLGAHEYVDGDDYPEYIACAAEKVSKDPDSKAIIFGGSGQGEAIVANRFGGVRAVVWYGGEKEILTLSREHNNANVLSIGARFVHDTQAQEAVKLWLQTEFTHDERHVRRIEKIEKVLHT
ncbi:ribose-5-phosphate isomerase [bacterium]|nr:ribose-5-phosphate isomerase [Parcubacteria group bacterium]MBF05464.1 ribose-5-phosphate isomerase [bacterium]|tara:strand:+ start:1192 stop:1647 length:456 start_codon:yes stop_codon:yes gene_type:complete